jgi:hypothetical protein
MIPILNQVEREVDLCEVDLCGSATSSDAHYRITKRISNGLPRRRTLFEVIGGYASLYFYLELSTGFAPP